ncbi:MAG: SCP2 sterol-binding domain-containing protein [Marmoricola sp.]|nr:SCP2 sterol-binding domain-containing protein [Marmoricola sp.]
MTDVIDRFAAMSADEVNEFFRSSDVLEITAVIAGASDDDLRRLIDLDHFRAEGVSAILDRFPEFADDARLREIEGVVRFELARGKRDVERHTARFEGGAVTLDPGAVPHVTITADIVDFVRLVTGQSNAALLYLGGRLGIDGHALLALAVGSVFTVPGSDQAAVDPASLDPVDVATAVATTSGKHMRSVMEGEFRPIVLAEVFRRFPEFIDPGKAADLALSVGFRIGGRRDGEVDRYVVHVRDGVCTIEADPPQGQRRDATITVDGADFLRLATGQLHPVRGVLTGALKVRGDRAKALALNAVMVPPQPRR